jgi:hypothetical protein
LLLILTGFFFAIIKAFHWQTVLKSLYLHSQKMDKKRPHIINQALLWEYDLDTFNYEKSYKIVIERVLERGNLEEWREMVKLYTREQILETIDWSAQLDQRDKEFSRFFLNSDFLHAA